jgi:predicted RNA methylase
MKISTEVVDVLEQCETDGNKLYLPPWQLERKLYVAVNNVLELAGLKWNRSEKAHVSDTALGDLLDTLILSGEIQDIKKELQYFPTPERVVDELFRLARLNDNVDYLTLEPSAGEGAIAKRLVEYGSESHCCEINTAFHPILHEIGCDIVGCDFMQFEPEYKYDAIIANPPFTRQQDINHVNRMLDLCVGRVVSVMSAGVTFRGDSKSVKFRERIERLGGHIKMLPEGSFKESGTMVNACIVAVDASGESSDS